MNFLFMNWSYQKKKFVKSYKILNPETLTFHVGLKVKNIYKNLFYSF